MLIAPIASTVPHLGPGLENFLPAQRQRLDYGTARTKGEPLGSGAMESTCRQ